MIDTELSVYFSNQDSLVYYDQIPISPDQLNASTYSKEHSILALGTTQGLTLYQISPIGNPVINLNIGSVNKLRFENNEILLMSATGIYQYDFENQNVLHKLLHRKVLSCWPDSSFTLIGSDSGFYKFSNGILDKISDDIVLDIQADQCGHYWIRTNSGLAVYNHSGIHHLSHERNELPTSLIRDLYIFPDGEIYAASQRFGLLKINYNADCNIGAGFNYEHFIFPGARKSPLQSNTVNAIEVYQDDLILGNYSAGLLYFDRDQKKLYPHLIFNQKPIPNITDLVIQDSMLWVVANDGIYLVNLNSQNIHKTAIPYRDLNSVCWQSGITYGQHVIFGAEKGLIVFDRNEIMSTKEYSPKVTIRKMLIDGQVKSMDKQQVFQYDQNNIEFHYGYVKYHAAFPALYKYTWTHNGNSFENTTASGILKFENLAPGDYQFEVYANAPDLKWSDQKALMSFTIEKPFWRKSWFQLGLFIIIICILVLIEYYRKYLRTREEKLVDEIRTKAAADFHDEIGNRIARLSLFAEILEKSIPTESEKSKEYLHKIQHSSQEIYHVLKDFLWTLNPARDRLSDLVIFLKDFIEEFLKETEMEFSSDAIPAEFEFIKLSLDEKRHLIMIFKEALTNILKHASASHVVLHFNVFSKDVELMIVDNGKGIPKGSGDKGLGISNMKKRASEIKSNLTVKSSPNDGTTISVKLINPIKKGNLVSRG